MTTHDVSLTEGLILRHAPFSVASTTDEPTAALSLLTEQIHEVEVDPFRFEVVWRNDKPTIEYQSSFGRTGTLLSSKLDVGPSPWLAPTTRPWVPLPSTTATEELCRRCR